MKTNYDNTETSNMNNLLAAFVALAFLVTAVPCQEVFQWDSIDYSVPEEGIQVFVGGGRPLTDVTITPITFKGKPATPSSAGGAGGTGNPTYSGQFDVHSLMGWQVTADPGLHDVWGGAQVSGHATADIVNGVGNAAAIADADSKVAYGGVVAHAEDTAHVAIGSAGAPVGVGGGITLLGIGGNFVVTVTPDQAAASTQSLNAGDTKGWKPGNEATVTMQTKCNGWISLGGGACEGAVDAAAKCGATVIFRP